MIVSTMVGQSSHDVLRGYRLHVTNLEPQAFYYAVRFWVTPPSVEPRWAAPLNQFFSMFGNAGVTQELFRRQGSVYVAGMTFAIEPQQTVSVGIGPLAYSSGVGDLSTVEGYVTIELPVRSDPNSATNLRRLPQSNAAVRVLLNPETTMVNEDHHGAGYTQQLDGVVTGRVSVTRLNFNIVEPIIPASGKAENEIDPNGIRLIEMTSLHDPHGTVVHQLVPEELHARGSQSIPDDERLRALMELLCELDTNASVLSQLNDILTQNQATVRLCEPGPRHQN
jgi:hypothetical protein